MIITTNPTSSLKRTMSGKQSENPAVHSAGFVVMIPKFYWKNSALSYIIIVAICVEFVLIDIVRDTWFERQKKG